MSSACHFIYGPSFTHPYSTILLPPLSPTISSPDCCRHEHCVYNCCASIIHSCQESCPTESPLSTADNHALQHSTFAIDVAVLFILTVLSYDHTKTIRPLQNATSLYFAHRLRIFPVISRSCLMIILLPYCRSFVTWWSENKPQN